MLWAHSLAQLDQKDVEFGLLTRDGSCVFSGDRLYSICLFPPVRELQVELLSLTSRMYPLAAHNSPESW